MHITVSAGYIVHDNGGTIHGYGANADLAWSDMLRTLKMAHIEVVGDDFDTSDYQGSWTRESGLKLAPATQALLDLVGSHGGDCGYAQVGGIACTRDEEGGN